MRISCCGNVGRRSGVSKPNGGREQVLIVEDDLEVYQAISRSLGCHGYRAEGVADGIRAMARIKGGDFTADVIALRLTRIHGVDLLREIRRMEGFLPAVMYVGIPGHSSQDRLQERGVFCVLIKGDASRDLVWSVEEACRTTSMDRRAVCA
jgi:DNA-binding NtrC family response regulator